MPQWMAPRKDKICRRQCQRRPSTVDLETLKTRYGLQRSDAYHCAVSNLQWFENVQNRLRHAAGHQEATASCRGVVDLPRAVDGAGGCREIRQHACQTEDVCFSWDLREVKGLADRFLYSFIVSFQIRL